MGIVFLCSGGGGNLRFLHTMAHRHGPIDLEITGVFGDRPGPAVETRSDTPSSTGPRVSTVPTTASSALKSTSAAPT